METKAKDILETERASSPRPALAEDICGAPRFEGGWGSICYQPKGHRPPHIFECGGGDDLEQEP